MFASSFFFRSCSALFFREEATLLVWIFLGWVWYFSNFSSIFFLTSDSPSFFSANTSSLQESSSKLSSSDYSLVPFSPHSATSFVSISIYIYYFFSSFFLCFLFPRPTLRTAFLFLEDDILVYFLSSLPWMIWFSVLTCRDPISDSAWVLIVCCSSHVYGIFFILILSRLVCGSD